MGSAIYPGAPDADARAYALARAQARIGNLGSGAIEHWSDCDEGSNARYNFDVGGTGSALPDTVNGGGFWSFSSGANGVGGLHLNGSAKVLPKVSNLSWHVMGRMILSTTPDALTIAQIGTLNNWAGVKGSVSTTKYVGVVGNTTNLISSVSIVNAFVELELWQNGVNCFLSANNEFPVSGALTVPTGGHPLTQFWNQTTGAVVTGQTDWWHFYAQKDQ